MLDALKKYLDLNQQAADVLNNIREANEAFIEGKRKLQPGDIVEVILLDEGKFYSVHSEGVVGRCVNGLSRYMRHIDQQVLTIKSLTDDSEYFNKSVNLLRYEVFAKKKDGKPSSKHLFFNHHNIPLFEDIEGTKEAKRFDYALRIKSK